jgi:hypothetical protein
MPPIRNLPDRPFTQLPKAALVALARQLNLDTTGTVVVLCARIRQHIEDNPAAIDQAQFARLFPLRPLPDVPNQDGLVRARGPGIAEEDAVDDNDDERFSHWSGIARDGPEPDSPRSEDTAPGSLEPPCPLQYDNTPRLSPVSSWRTPSARGPPPSSRISIPATPPFSEFSVSFTTIMQPSPAARLLYDSGLCRRRGGTPFIRATTRRLHVPATYAEEVLRLFPAYSLASVFFFPAYMPKRWYAFHTYNHALTSYSSELR